MQRLRATFATEIRQVDQALAIYLRRFREPASHYHIIRYHLGLEVENDLDSEARLHARGKRLRAILCLLIGRSLGAPAPILTTLMVASELLHNASLVHDDVQDAEPERWGRSTVWAKFGIDQAINAGDAMVAMSFDVLLQLRDQGVASPLVLEATDRYLKAYLRMAEGQHSDLLGAGAVSRAEYLAMIARKTAAPIECFSAATALVAGGSPAVEESFCKFGRSFGMLYQVCDDIRAIWGDPTDTGKKAKRDIQLRKPSLPLLVGLEQCSARLKTLVHAPKEAPPLTDGEVEEIATELTGSEALSTCRAIADGYRDDALEHLHAAFSREADSGAKTLLETMVRLCADTAVGAKT